MIKLNSSYTLLMLIGLLFCHGSYADIYKYVASDGSVYFSDSPKNKRYKRVVTSKRKNKSKKGRIAYRALKKNKKKFHPLIESIALNHEIDPKLLHAIIRAESAYDPNAISRAGAVGLMQLMPGTAKRYGVSDRRNPNQNITGGTRYLKDLLAMFNSNLKLAVAAYNAGENAVVKYRNSIPPYPETQNYVKKVLAFYKKTS